MPAEGVPASFRLHVSIRETGLRVNGPLGSPESTAGGDDHGGCGNLAEQPKDFERQEGHAGNGEMIRHALTRAPLSVSRSTACLIDLIGGKRNWFG